MHEKHTYFCALSTIFLPFFIIRLTGSCHSPLLSHVTAFSSLSYRMKITRRFWVHPGGTRLRTVPYRTARQHSTLHLPGRLFRSMHMLFSEAKSQVSHITVPKKPQSLKRESKSWDHTYSENWGKPHGECELLYCLTFLGFPSGTHKQEPLQHLHHRADLAAPRTSQFWSFSSFSCSFLGLHSPVCFFSIWGRDR